MTRNSEAFGVVGAPELDAPSADARFHAVLRDSIWNGMTGVLGVEGTQAILYHLDLPSFDDPKKFHERLTEIFGFGTASLEGLILQRLRQAIGVSLALVKNEDFVSQVERARRIFDAKERREGRGGWEGATV